MENKIETLRIENIFEEEEFLQLEKYLKSREYKPLENDFIYCSRVPGMVGNTILNKIKEVTSLNLKEIVTFARLNTSTVDARIKIHSDNIVMGKQPSYASVYYIETNDESGTAILSSPTHGKERTDLEVTVFTEMGDFEVVEFNTEVRNSLFLYKSLLFHSRWPTSSRGLTVEDGRIVVVSFWEET
jgi:hypothetical protein